MGKNHKCIKGNNRPSAAQASTNAQKAKNTASKIKSFTQRLREAHIKAFCMLDRAKVKTDWKSTIRNFAIRVKVGSQLYASLILKGTKWYLDSHTMVPELTGFITSPLARGIAYSFLEAQGAVAIAGAIAFAPELAVGGPAGVAVDASIAAIGSLMFFAGDAGRRQAADDLAEEWGHNKGAEGENNSHLSNQQANKIKQEILEGNDVHFKTKEEALEFIEKKFPNFKQEVAGNRSSEGWHFDSHSINGSTENIDHINIYSKKQGFRVHITWGD